MGVVKCNKQLSATLSHLDSPDDSVTAQLMSWPAYSSVWCSMYVYMLPGPLVIGYPHQSYTLHDT